MRLFILSLLMLSSPAFAFSQQGNTATLLLAVGLGGFTATNLLLQITFYLSGKYQQEAFIKRHIAISLLPCALMFAVTIYDYAGVGPLMMHLGGIIFAAAFALLPYQLVALKPITSNRPWLLTLAALVFLGAGTILGPVNIFAVATAYSAIQVKGKLNSINTLILFTSCAFFCYWLWQQIQLFL